MVMERALAHKILWLVTSPPLPLRAIISDEMLLLLVVLALLVSTSIESMEVPRMATNTIPPRQVRPVQIKDNSISAERQLALAPQV
jgi:hypothetical protein